MKPFSRYFIAPLAALAALSFTACGGDDEGPDGPSGPDGSDGQTVTILEEYKCFALNRNASGATVLDDDVTFSFDITASENHSSVKITVKGLDAAGADEFTLPAIDLIEPTDPSQPLTASAATLTAEDASVSVSNLSIKMLRRYIGVTYQPVYEVSMTVGGVNSIVAYPFTSYYMAQTNSAEANGSYSFTTRDTQYRLTVDPSAMTAKVDIIGARFHERMPALDMTFNGLTYTYAASSAPGFELAAPPTLIPEIKGTPFPAFPISGFVATLPLLGNGTLSFSCDVPNMGTYNVSSATSPL